MRARFRLWIEDGEGNQLFGEGLQCLLKEIQRTGSLRGGAESMGMSYRHAWGKIRKAEERLGYEIVHRQSGGSGGGNSGITSDGQSLLTKFDLLQQDLLNSLEKHVPNRFGLLP
ncbi:MAG TPA: LysR family transcriptional regulator [Bacillota bacterium]|nr:LysR family transcriptional regulator [Bacillota bacterium]